MSEALIAYLSGVCNFARGVAWAVIFFTPIAFVIADVNFASDREKKAVFWGLIIAIILLIFVPTKDFWKLL